jgi:hypothetical protein
LCGGQLAAQFGDRRAIETPNELPWKLRSGRAHERIAIHQEFVYVFCPSVALVEAEEVSEPRWLPVHRKGFSPHASHSLKPKARNHASHSLKPKARNHAFLRGEDGFALLAPNKLSKFRADITCSFS